MTEYPFPGVVLRPEGEFTIIYSSGHSSKKVVDEKGTPSVFVYFAATLSLKSIYYQGHPTGKVREKDFKTATKHK